MVEKEITAEVKRAWVYYQYATNLCSMYRDQDKMAEELQRIGELRYQQGEITLLEKNMMTTIAADLHNRWFQAKEEEKMALARFQWSCYSTIPLFRWIPLYPYSIPAFRMETYREHILPTFKARQMKRKQCSV